MKRILALSTILFTSLIVFSCEQPTMLSVSQTALTFENAGGNQSVTLTANKVWTASSNQGWLRVSPSSGEGNASLSISCEGNTNYDSRTGTITIISEELTSTISVTQAEGLGLLISQPEYNLSNEAQNIDVTVQANVQYTVDIDNACRDWIKQQSTKGLSSNTIKFAISKNESYDGREGKITIRQTNGNLSAIVIVKQSQMNGLFADKTEYEVSYEEQLLNIKVKSNVNYEVQLDDNCKDWISRVQTKGLVESTVILAIAKNEGKEREGKIILKYGGVEEAVRISQGGGFVEFEDENFKEYCVNEFDLNHDGKISYAEAKSITKINVSTNTIASLKGIEYMPNLDSLICKGASASNKGKLVLLDISNNHELAYLNCSNNLLTNLDVSHNTSLFNLDCNNNRITSLDVNRNPLLNYINCSNNPLSIIDIRHIASLQQLRCTNCELDSLDVSNNSLLKMLICGSNLFSSLDVSDHPSLEELSCIGGKVEIINAIDCPSLTSINCKHNKIKTLCLKGDTALVSLDCSENQLISLDISGLKSLSIFKFGDNPLTSLNVSECISLTSISNSDSKLNSLNARGCSALTDIFVDRSSLTTLDVRGCIALRCLSCGWNQLQTIDISDCTELSEFRCPNNELESLDLSRNSSLELLYCQRNKIISLDITNNPELVYLECSSNALFNLDVSTNTKLISLGCASNNISILDISNNLALEGVSCMSNRIMALDVSNNLVLDRLRCYSNPNLTKIWLKSGQKIQDFQYDTDIATVYYVDGLVPFEDANFKAYCVQKFDTDGDGEISYNEAQSITIIKVKTDDIKSLKGIEYFKNLSVLDCQGTYDYEWDSSLNGYVAVGHGLLTTLDLRKNTALTKLYCSANHLTSLDLSQNTALTTLYCQTNLLANLDLSHNTALTTLYCKTNQLTHLDLSGCPLLTEMIATYNQLSSLDVSQNRSLTVLDCNNNQMLSLNVSQNTALKELSCAGNQLTSLDVCQNTALTSLLCTYNNLTSLDVSNNSLLTSLNCENNPSLFEIWLNTGQIIKEFRYDTGIATIKYK